jgi:beta-N-acetylhexosaminidase
VEEPLRGAERARVAERRRRERRSRTVRRRRLGIVAAAAAAFVVGVSVGATAPSGAPDPRASDPSASAPTGGGRGPRPSAALPGHDAAARDSGADRLPLERQVGRLVVLRFTGTRVPAYVRRWLRQGRATGAILFRDNVRDPAQLRALTRSLRAAGGPGTLVAVDQEGGRIRIVPWAPPSRPGPAQGAAGTAGADARAAAGALRRAGVNVALAPVADVPHSGSVMAGRVLGSTPQTVAQGVAAAVRGWRAGGLAPAVKHFPGLGAARVNTDHGSVAIRRSRAALDADLAPFKAALSAGVPLVMVGHAVYPALDPDHIASQSPAIATTLLRGTLRFGGVSVTDSLEAAAARATGRVDEAAVASLRAGVDLMLTTGRGSAGPVYRGLLAAARRDPRVRDRVRESAARVERLRAQLVRPGGTR